MTPALDLEPAPRLETIRSRIDEALRGYTNYGDGCPAELREAIQYSLLTPGKRLRPVLTVLAAEACGGTIEAALPAACAVEMIHAYSLIHDDLPAMDNDDLRRGQPTCHKKYGEAMAILAGDALLARAFEVVACGVQPAAVAAGCCAALGEAAGACQLVGGQADDMRGTWQSGGIRALEWLHQRKTGAMIRVALRLGAMTAGADPPRLAALDEYGRRIGLAFQITDDLLDVRGNAADVGKRVGKDSAQGKLTFPALLGVASSHERAEQLIAEACAALAPLGAQGEGLEAVARYVLQRNC